MFKTLDIDIKGFCGPSWGYLGIRGPGMAALGVCKRHLGTHGCILGHPGVILGLARPAFAMPNVIKSGFGLHAGVVSHPKVILGLAAHLAGTAFEE